MSELKRNMDFAAGNRHANATPDVAGIDESQPWRTDMQKAMDRWTSADPGFDPYNHVGTQARKSRAA